MKPLLLCTMLFVLSESNLPCQNIKPIAVVAQTKIIKVSEAKYDLSHPQKRWELPHQLLEISGISWLGTDSVLAIEDLHPNLYLLNLKANKIVVEKTVQFKKDKDGKKFDVEDVTVVNNIVYALWSHGGIYKISDWQHNIQVKKIKTCLSKENNTEGICYDPLSGKLLIACKNDADEKDEKKSTRAIYEYSIEADSLLPVPFMTIHKKDFKKFLGENEKFYPSAIAVHPITHDIYILSTKKSKCMAVFTHDGLLKSFKLFDKNLLPQPEGICFSPEGTLYISTEGKEGGYSSICQFNMK